MHLNCKEVMYSCLSPGENETGTRRLLVFGGFPLALLLSGFLAMYAQGLGTDSSIVEPKDGRNTNRTEQPIEPETTRDNISLVGPSGEEIHDFLYPTPED